MSWWSSVDSLSKLLNWVGVLTATMACVTATLKFRYDFVKRMADRTKAEERARIDAEFSRQTKEAERQLSQAHERVAALEAKSQPREITPEQQKALREAMHKEFANGINVPIIIASKMLDPESESYAKQISAALPLPPEALGLTTLGTFGFQSLRIFPIGDLAVDAADRVRRAFTAAGIPFSTETDQANRCPIHPDVGVFIFVGYK